MITEDHVSFETAKLLKEKGFKSDNCHTAYDENSSFFWYGDYSKDRKGIMDAPTLQMAMKWLREVHHLTIDIFHFRDWKVNIKTTDDYLKADYDNPELKSSETYEEAAESAIKYCLENLI